MSHKRMGRTLKRSATEINHLTIELVYGIRGISNSIKPHKRETTTDAAKKIYEELRLSPCTLVRTCASILRCVLAPLRGHVGMSCFCDAFDKTTRKTFSAWTWYNLTRKSYPNRPPRSVMRHNNVCSFLITFVLGRIVGSRALINVQLSKAYNQSSPVYFS